MKRKEQQPLKEEKKATGKISVVENSEPCCIPVVVVTVPMASSNEHDTFIW
jgi:hypothetical protein